MKRRCKICPPATQAVCRHAFGVYWCIKSGDGEGCSTPLDDVAKSWRRAGWTPDKGEAVPMTLSVKKSPKAGQVQLDLMPAATLPPLSDDDY